MWESLDRSLEQRPKALCNWVVLTDILLLNCDELNSVLLK